MGFVVRTWIFLVLFSVYMYFVLTIRYKYFTVLFLIMRKDNVRVKTDIGKMNFFIKIRNIVAYDEKIYFKSRTKRLQFNSLEVFQNADDALQEH